MSKHRTPLLLLLLPAVVGIGLPGTSRAQQATANRTAAITVMMEDCRADRPGKIASGASILLLLFAGPPKEELVKRGTLQVDGRKYTLYLPKAKTYSTANTKPGDNDLESICRKPRGSWSDTS